MGLYIEDSEDQNKEELLWEYMLAEMPVEYIDWQVCRTNDSLPVVLVDNGHFKAAAVAYTENLLNTMRQKNDVRPKTGFILKIDDINILTDNSLDDYL